MMFYIQLFGGLAFLVSGLFLAVINWGVVVQWALRGKQSSWIPLLGGLLTSIGIVVLPYPPLQNFWWVPFIVDWGSLPGLIFTTCYFVARKTPNRR